MVGTEFIKEVLKMANGQFEQSILFKREGLEWDILLSRVADYYEADVEDQKTRSNASGIVKARSIFYSLAVRK